MESDNYFAQVETNRESHQLTLCTFRLRAQEEVEAQLELLREEEELLGRPVQLEYSVLILVLEALEERLERMKCQPELERLKMNFLKGAFAIEEQVVQLVEVSSHADKMVDQRQKEKTERWRGTNRGLRNDGSD
jgi:hypothetical protein